MNEFFTLFVIQLFFTLSFVLRAWWDKAVYGDDPTFRVASGDLFLTIPFDILPVSLIMFFHYRNFRVKPTEELPQV